MPTRLLRRYRVGLVLLGPARRDLEVKLRIHAELRANLGNTRA